MFEWGEFCEIDFADETPITSLCFRGDGVFKSQLIKKYVHDHFKIGEDKSYCYLMGTFDWLSCG